MTRAFATALIVAFAAGAAASVGGAANADRSALARAEAALLAASTVPDTRCPSDESTRDARDDAGCAADAPHDDGSDEPAPQAAPTARPATGVCARNPETGRRKCSVRYLA